MPAAEFEEREYESAALIELAEGGGAVFTPGQVLEKIVGYDSVAAPVRGHILWRLLRVRRPAGLTLLPTMWPAVARPTPNELPIAPVSVILQYKRPEYLRAPQSAQWHLWGTAYFRFARRDAQHRVLRQLESRAGSDVVVRYAAPAFWRRSELEHAHLARQVLRSSGFVSPSSFGHHRVWSYVSPGVTGQFNPSGRGADFETYEALHQRWRSESLVDERNLPATRTTLPDHLAHVAQALAYRRPAVRRVVQAWMRSVVNADLGLSQRDLDLLADYATISSTIVQLRAVWFVGSREPPDTTKPTA